MSQELKSFLVEHCTRSPAAVVPVIALMRAFRQSLPPDAQGEWTRQRLVSELLASGLTCGVRNKTYHVAGLALRGQWKAINGRLTLEAVR